MLYRLDNIRRQHGLRTVLDISELSIEQGKIYTLIGPNGAGKTSLLKILAFLDKPTAGKLFFLNQETLFTEKHLVELRRQVVLLDQSPIMFSGSVLKNIEFGLKIRNVPSKERLHRIEEALHTVGMENFKEYEARSLSGGETKRVALARAMVLRPRVLLCDEPTANVDSENQEIILNVLEKINKDQQSSILFSTHYLSQAQRLADHTLFLQHGSLSSVVNENIYRATVTNRQSGRFTCQLTGQLFLRLPERVFPSGGSVVKLHIDPKGLQLNPEQSETAGGNVLTGHLTELRQDGGHVRVSVNVGVKLTLVLSLQEYRRVQPGIGDKVRVLVPDSSVAFTTISG